MHAEDIKAIIRKKYGTLRALAVAIGVHEVTVRRALANPVPTAEGKIASAIGMTVVELWPERYTPEILNKPTQWRRKRAFDQSATQNNCTTAL